MKLAFSGQARFADFAPGYALYKKRSRKGEVMDYAQYKRVVHRYCDILAERLLKQGMTDLPCGLGSIAAARMMRKPQYRGKQFIGYGKRNWKDHGRYDGSLYAFGLVFLSGRGKKGKDNLRSFGFVANRRLFQKMRDMYEAKACPWKAMQFTDDMI